MPQDAMPPDLSKIVSRLTTIQRHVEQITGLPSRWNGQVNLSEDVDAHNRPAFAGKKEWDCSITVHMAFLDVPGSFESLIHECLHAVSVGLEPLSFYRYRGYEEGVVEKATLLIGPQVAAAMKITAEFDRRSAYMSYLGLLEKLRVTVGKSDVEFTLELLRTPLAAREQTVVQWAINAHPQEAPVRVLAGMTATLRGLRERP